MTLPAVIRIFFAIDLPDTTKEKIAEFIALLKRKSKTNAIRWTKTDNLHITLQFLAEVRTEHLPMLINNVKSELRTVRKNIQFNFGALKLFPHPYRPRVIVLDITPQAELTMLAHKIGAGILHSAYPTHERPFHGHLTIGRIKHTGVNLSFLADAELPALGKINIEAVILFRSEPQSDGSKYSVLARMILAKNALAS